MRYNGKRGNKNMCEETQCENLKYIWTLRSSAIYRKRTRLKKNGGHTKIVGNVQGWKIRCLFVNGYFERVADCPEPKRGELQNYLKQIQYTSFDITQEALDVAKQIVAMGILTERSFDDCQHIGIAVINECDCIISWNFRHIVNIKTIRGVRSIANLQGYKPIEIWNPTVLLEGEE